MDLSQKTKPIRQIASSVNCGEAERRSLCEWRLIHHLASPGTGFSFCSHSILDVPMMLMETGFEIESSGLPANDIVEIT